MRERCLLIAVVVLFVVGVLGGLEIAVFGGASVEPHTGLAVTWRQMKAE